MFELNNYLKSLPQDYKVDHGFKDWLHDVTDIDTMRNIIMTVESALSVLLDIAMSACLTSTKRHALCCHFHYALTDVLRMNGISLAVHVAYEHIYK